MGKEPSMSIRIPHKPKPSPRYNNIKALREESNKKWSSQKQIVSKYDITENGRVFLYMRTKEKDTTIVCAGISKKGNSYKDLLGQLQKNGIISSLSQIKGLEVFTDNGWEKVDIKRDTFSANDSIVLALNEALKTKTI
eukprot:TRINITY_DN10888_c0_g1_i15.p2 TRINITY_DN10888_c0_g1~~TRINITY_DN10888_c0_g1_i15.p2  ORF type:complete len:138 (-),score=32.23 TRINITY_DN10888_c0_g1_i15:1417-1830(-)